MENCTPRELVKQLLTFTAYMCIDIESHTDRQQHSCDKALGASSSTDDNGRGPMTMAGGGGTARPAGLSRPTVQALRLLDVHQASLIYHNDVRARRHCDRIKT